VSVVSAALADQETCLVTLGTLHRKTAEVFNTMLETGKWVVITHRGRFVGLLQPLDDHEVVGELISSLVAIGAFGDLDAPVGQTFSTEEVARALGLPEPDFEERDLDD
jgi:hypothetical protein